MTDKSHEHQHATAPRLSILHLLMWTGVTALLMAMVRFFNDERGYSVPTSRHVLQLLYSLAAAPAIATLVVCPFWRRRGYRFPLHAGEWILLVASLLFIKELAQMLLFFLMVRFSGDPHAYSAVELHFMIGAGFSTCVCLLLVLSVCFIGQVRWRMFLLPLLCASVLTAIAECYATLGSVSSLDGPLWRARELLMAYDGISLAVLVLLGAVVDALRHRGLPWTHWVGIGCYVSHGMLLGLPWLLADLFP